MSAGMRAAVLAEFDEPLEIAEVERPEPEPHGVVIEVEACGICRSDWHGWKGHMSPELKGTIIGHEPAGRVVAVGDAVDGLREGDRVAAAMNLADGSCHRCLSGKSNLCENQRVFGFDLETQGAWAEELAIPWADVNTVKLPDDASVVDMAGLGCRFMTGYNAVAHRTDVGPGDWVAVHGCGGIGLSAIQTAAALGAAVVAVDIEDEKLEFASDLGADETVNASAVEDVPGEIHDITDGGANVSVDALGIAETCQNSIDSLGFSGQHVQVGVPTPEDRGAVKLPIGAMLGKEIEVVGNVGMPPSRFGEILRMYDRGKLDPGAQVTREVSIEEVSDRLAAMTDYGTLGIEVITEF